jgi:hypothetical protein
MYGLEFVLMLSWRLYCKPCHSKALTYTTLTLVFSALDMWQNRRRSYFIQDMGLSEEESMHQGRLNAESDMTDWDNIHFKYSL